MLCEEGGTPCLLGNALGQIKEQNGVGTDRDREKRTKEMRHVGVRRTLEGFKSFVVSQNVSVNLKLRPNNKLGNRVLLKHRVRPHLSLESPPTASPSLPSSWRSPVWEQAPGMD